MAPKPIWGTISSYFYPADEEEAALPVVASPGLDTAKDQVDEDGWMLVGPKRAPSPDADEVGSVIMVNHGSESDSEGDDTEKTVCEVEDKAAVRPMKQMTLVQQMLFQHTAAASADRATVPKNNWKARNSTFNKSKQARVRASTRNPGRRNC